MGDSWINCSACGHRYGSWISGCSQCGAKNGGFKKKGMGKGKKIAVGAGVVVAAFFALALVVAAMTPDRSDLQAGRTESAMEASQLQSSLVTSTSIGDNVKKESFSPVQEKLVIVDGTVKVNAGGYTIYTFSLPPEATKARLSGTFQTSDPTGIKVFVVDKAMMDQWKQGKRIFYYGNIFYTSETRVTSGSVNLGVVGTGTYYLVFDNTEVLDQRKDVATDMELSYTRYTS